MIKVFRHIGTNKLDAYDLKKLNAMGFYIASPKYHIIGNAHASKKLDVNEYTMIHCCCEHGNLLSRPITSADKQVKFVDISEDEDFTRRDTVDKAIAGINGPGDIFSVVLLVRGVRLGSA